MEKSNMLRKIIRKRKQKKEEEKKEYAKFCELTEEQIKELNEISEDFEVITPDNMLESYFQNIPEIMIFLYLTIFPNNPAKPNTKTPQTTQNHSNDRPSYVANLIYNTKNQTFEHHIIKPFEKQWAESRQKYREYYNFLLLLYEVVEIYSRKGGKGRKKVRYYIVCFNTESESGIKKISKRKAYKKAINNSQKFWF